ncbi:hypothetical protein NKH18_24385 [Streptomyces sp. M10(2022)]
MVGREREPGSRRDRYRLRDEVWYDTFTSRDRLLTRWERTLRDGARSLGEDTPAGVQIAQSAQFLEFMQAELMTLMEKWHESRGP